MKGQDTNENWNFFACKKLQVDERHQNIPRSLWASRTILIKEIDFGLFTISRGLFVGHIDKNKKALQVLEYH